MTESLLEHLKWLRRAARDARADLVFAGETLQALLRRGRRHLVLHPQLLATIDGVTRRTPHLHDASEAFLGWLPYRSKHWPIAIDRLAFKQHAAAAGLPVPQLPPAAVTSGAVVVRRAPASFEPFLRGPFRSSDQARIDPARGEYCEPHLEGDALTVWFWDGEPICAERVAMPVVAGDGVTTLGDLVLRASDAGRRLSPAEMRAQLAECAAIAGCRGLTLSTVLPADQKLVVGLGHGSSLLALRARRILDLRSGSEAPPWMPLLRKAGPLLLAGVPEEIRPATLFTVNAIVRGDGGIWLLDMDASPRIHPFLYAAMLRSLLPEEARPEVALQQ